MKTAISLFILGFTSIVFIPYFAVELQIDRFETLGDQHPFLSTYAANLRDTLSADGPPQEKELRMGYVQHLVIKGGIELIHDEAMGNSVKATGPAEALAALSIRHSEGSYTLGFSQPLRLSEPVRISLDLNHRLMKELKINLSPGQHERLVPAFITKTTLRVPLLQLMGCYVLPTLKLAVNRLEFGSPCIYSEQISRTTLGQISGTVDRIVSIGGNKPYLNSPEARINQADIYSNSISTVPTVTSADTVNIHYTLTWLSLAENPNNEGRVDTIYVRPNAVVNFFDESSGSPLSNNPEKIYVVRQ